MISSLGRVMIYVNDTEKCAKFWHEKIDFNLDLREELPNGYVSISLSPKENPTTGITLHSREMVAAMHPDMNLGTPSILMETKNISELHDELRKNGVEVSEISDMGGMKNFHFPDPEGNYFAVREV